MKPRRTIVWSLLLALTLAVGFGVAWGVIVAFCGSIAESYALQGNFIYEYIYTLPDGTPVIETQKSYPVGTVAVRTLDGKTLPEDTRQSLQRPAELYRLKTSGPYWRTSWEQRVLGFNDARLPPDYWYFVHDGRLDGRAWFEGYDSESRLSTGFIGAKGFRRTRPPRGEQFAVDGWRVAQNRAFVGHFYSSGYMPANTYARLGPDELPSWKIHLFTQAGVAEIDLRQRTARILPLPQETFLSGNQVSIPLPREPGAPPDAPPRGRVDLAFRTADAVLLHDPRSGQTRRHVIPQAICGAQAISASWTTTGVAVFDVTKRQAEAGPLHDLYWVAPSGRVLRHERVELRATRGLFDSQPSWAAAVAPTPLAMTAMAALLSLDYLQWGSEPDYATALRRSLRKLWPALVLTYLLGIGLAWWTWRHQRQYHARGTIAWMVFVFLLGLPGAMGYWVHRHWPVRAICPNCSQLAPRDRAQCASCGREFPAPARNGLEVVA